MMQTFFFFFFFFFFCLLCILRTTSSCHCCKERANYHFCILLFTSVVVGDGDCILVFQSNHSARCRRVTPQPQCTSVGPVWTPPRSHTLPLQHTDGTVRIDTFLHFRTRITRLRFTTFPWYWRVQPQPLHVRERRELSQPVRGGASEAGQRRTSEGGNDHPTAESGNERRAGRCR